MYVQYMNTILNGAGVKICVLYTLEELDKTAWYILIENMTDQCSLVPTLNCAIVQLGMRL